MLRIRIRSLGHPDPDPLFTTIFSLYKIVKNTVSSKWIWWIDENDENDEYDAYDENDKYNEYDEYIYLKGGC